MDTYLDKQNHDYHSSLNNVKLISNKVKLISLCHFFSNSHKGCTKLQCFYNSIRMVTIIYK